MGKKSLSGSFSNDLNLVKTDSKCARMVLSNNLPVRSGCKDVWNAFMAEGAVFGIHDIPFCPTTAITIPNHMVTWEEAKQIHKKHLVHGDTDYHEDAFVNWYIDDIKFDGPHGIWHDHNTALKILCHFAGVITPDWSTYQDFPEAIKIYSTYRMRTYGYWLGKKGIAVINNVRWGTEESYSYCFEGIPTNSIVAIGTVGGGPRKLIDRQRFRTGFFKMIETLRPHTILVYGSSNDDCFSAAIKMGIHVISFQSKTDKFFDGRKS